MFFYDLHDNLLGVREQTSTGQNRFEMYAHVDGDFAHNRARLYDPGFELVSRSVRRVGPCPE